MQRRHPCRPAGFAQARQGPRPGIGASLIGSALLLACASRLPEPAPLPVIPVPEQFSESGATPGASAANATPAAGQEWWRSLANHELDGLIDRALANNPDMRVAIQHIVQAKARLDQARATHLPTVTAPLLVGDQSAGSSGVGTPPAGGTVNPGGSQKTWQAGIRADWQIDLWGEQSALAASVRFQLQRAMFERDNVARNLAAAITQNYIQYLSLNDRRRIAGETDALQSATLSSIEARVKAGDATMADLEQQRAAIFSVRATVPVLEQQRQDSLTALAQLTGTLPARLKLSEHGLDSLSRPRAAPGLPSQLLLRRPDIRLAEAQLRSARADVLVARARLMPPMDLAAQIGRSAGSPAQLLMPQTLFWSVVNSLTVTLFDGGRKHQEEVYSRAVEEEMVEGYARAIHQALREVDSALLSLRLSDQRMSAEQETLDAARRAMDISMRIYKVGGVDYLTLLDTQRTYHHYLDNYQQAREAQFRGYVALFQALGGDTQTLPPASDKPATGKLGSRISGACLAGLPGDAGQPAPGGDWQVELQGNYHCATVAPAWRDLYARYPDAMRDRALRPVLSGRVEDDLDGEQSWFRLSISGFASADQARTFCAALQADQLRCQVSATRTARPLDAGTHAAAHPATVAATGPHEPDGLELSALEPELVPGGGALPPTATPVVAGPGPAAQAGRPGAAVPVRSAEARPSASRYLQIGAFRDFNRAEALRLRASEGLPDGSHLVSMHQDGPLFLIWAGPFADSQSERSTATRLRDLTGSMPRSVRGRPALAGAS